MIEQNISILCPARIHFGLFSVSAHESFRFGGAGMMVDEPAIELQARPAEKWTVIGKHSDLIRKYSIRWFAEFGHAASDYESLDQFPLEVELKRFPKRHSGFGSGTQIAFSVARLLFESAKIDVPETSVIAKALNRGRRSAIGSHGFEIGGVLVDRGIANSEDLSPLISRTEFPTGWRIVLITPQESTGSHGKLENVAFEEMTGKVQSNRDRLFRLCNQEIIPAIADGDYDRLGKPLFDFNRSSGQYFSDYQHGCYHDQACKTIVNHVQNFGIHAVGQSSWGPCIFAITKTSESANELVKYLKQVYPQANENAKIEFTITAGNNFGAKFQPDLKPSCVQST